MTLPKTAPKEGEIWAKGLRGERTYWYFFKGVGGQLKRGQLEPIYTRKFSLKKIHDEGRGRVHFQCTISSSGEFPAENIVHGRDTWKRLWDTTVPPPRRRI